MKPRLRSWLAIITLALGCLLIAALELHARRSPRLVYATCIETPIDAPRRCPPDSGQAVLARWGDNWFIAVFDHQRGAWWLAVRDEWLTTPADEWQWPIRAQHDRQLEHFEERFR